jgi:hypothetical protein
MAKDIKNEEDALIWTVNNLLNELYQDTEHLNETARKFTMQILVINILEKRYGKVKVNDKEYDAIAIEIGKKGVTGKTIKTWLTAGTNITDEHLIDLAEFYKKEKTKTQKKR